MRVYSAGEAIGPAWEHAKLLLWGDRNWKRLLKICFVAVFAELGGLNLNGSFRNGHGAQLPASAAAAFAAIGLVVAVIALVIGMVIFYIGSRLQFVMFDMLVLRDPYVAPAWQRHGRHTWRWIGVKLTAMLAVGLALSPLLVPAIITFVAMARRFSVTGTGTAARMSHPPVFAMVLAVAELGAVVVLFATLMRFITTLALPTLALEDLSYTGVFRRAWQIFGADVGGMLLFAVLEVLVLIGFGIVGILAVALAIVAALLPLSLVGGLLWAAVHKIAVAGNVLVGCYAVIAVLVLVVWAAACYLIMLGSLYTFARAWGLYFVGGRYPLLGQYLEPTNPAVPWTPPPSLPQEKDDESGPAFPADPAMA